MTLNELNLPNLKSPEQGIYSCGQPSREQLQQLRDAGVRTVVSLRGEGECDFDERAAVEDLGMAFHQVPVDGPKDITEHNARRLSQIMADESGRPILIHCGSGNRVGALYALKAFHCDGREPEDAVARGRSAGLTQLEPLVRQCFERD